MVKPARFAEWQEDTYGNRMDMVEEFWGRSPNSYVTELADRCAAYQDYLAGWVVKQMQDM